MAKELSKYLGVKMTLTSADAVNLLNIEKLLAGEVTTIEQRTHAGFYDENGEQVYVIDKIKITRRGITAVDHPLVFQEHGNKASKLSMQVLPIDDVRQVVNDGLLAMLKMKDMKVTTVTLASLLVPLVCDLLGEKSPIIILLGASSTLKTTFLGNAMCLYGDFARTGSMIPASSTPNAIEKEAHHFRGTPVPIDDVKHSVITNHNRFMAIFQNAYDGNARKRLGSSCESRPEFPIYGMPILCGEDHPWPTMESLNGRSIVIPWEGSQSNFDAANRVKPWLSNFNGILPHFIQYLLEQGKTKLKVQFDAIRQTFMAGHTTEGNKIRIINHLALLELAWKLLTGWMTTAAILPQDVVTTLNLEFKTGIQAVEVANQQYLQQSRAGEIFLRHLNELLASDRVFLEEVTPSSTISVSLPTSKRKVGFRRSAEAGKVYLLPGEAVAAVQEMLRSLGQSQTFNSEAISRDLLSMNAILERGSKGVAKQVRHAGRQTWVWVIDAKALGLEAASANSGVSQTDPNIVALAERGQATQGGKS